MTHGIYNEKQRELDKLYEFKHEYSSSKQHILQIKELTEQYTDTNKQLLISKIYDIIFVTLGIIVGIMSIGMIVSEKFPIIIEIITIAAMFIVVSFILLNRYNKNNEENTLLDIKEKLEIERNNLHKIYLRTNKCIPEKMALQINKIINILETTSVKTINEAIGVYLGSKDRRY